MKIRDRDSRLSMRFPFVTKFPAQFERPSESGRHSSKNAASSRWVVDASRPIFLSGSQDPGLIDIETTATRAFRLCKQSEAANLPVAGRQSFILQGIASDLSVLHSDSCLRTDRVQRGGVLIAMRNCVLGQGHPDIHEGARRRGLRRRLCVAAVCTRCVPNRRADRAQDRHGGNDPSEGGGSGLE